MALNYDFFDSGGIHQESALNSNAIAGSAADREIAVVAAFPQAYDCTFEFLNSLSIAFFDFDVHTDHIARAQLWDVFIDRGFDGFN
jgi:hypothetical protein